MSPGIRIFARRLAVSSTIVMVLGVPELARPDDDPPLALIYGDGFSFLVQPPPGWILENPSGGDLYALFYPEGKTWDGAAAVMYVNAAPRKRGQTLQAFIASEASDFKRDVGGRLKVRAMDPIPIASGAAIPVRSFTGDPWGNREAVAYLESPGAFVVIALTSRNAEDFTASLPAFRALVASWRFVPRGKAAVFEAALAAAKSNGESDSGARYDGEFGARFGQLSAEMKRCTAGAPPSETVAFDMVVRVAADGSIEDAQVRPETEMSRCLCASVRRSQFPPPPRSHWWVQVHMEIRP